MTVVCLKGCEREWPRDPILEVGCPVCHAPVGAKCRNPSGWTKWGDNAFHAERDIAADRAGAYGTCPLGLCGLNRLQNAAGQQLALL
jgi:hypothetical protein